MKLDNYKHKNVDSVRNDVEINDDTPFVLKQIVKYINDNIKDKIAISDLAKQTRWESQHFNRLFTKYLGITPHKYIINKKIDKAKILLAESNIPVIEVSFELGFKSHSNFCAIFKKDTGKTPDGYRKWIQANAKLTQ